MTSYQSLSVRRNNCARLFDQTDRLHRGCVRHDVKACKIHRDKVREVCEKLDNEGKQYICRAHLMTNHTSDRLCADIVVLDDFEVHEIPYSEKRDSLERKKIIYAKYGLKMVIDEI